MRPCPRCGVAIPNNAEVCSDCTGKPEAVFATPQPSRVEQESGKALEPDESSAVYAILLCVFVPLTILTPVCGYWAFGSPGAISGGVIAFNFWVVLGVVTDGFL